MSTLYYVTAAGPSTIYVGGKSRQLQPGDTQGPFTEAELSQIMASPDRRKLMTTSFEGPSPTKKSSTLLDEQPTPVSEEVLFQEAGEESLVLITNDVPPASLVSDLQLISTEGEYIPTPEAEFIHSSFTQELPFIPLEDTVAPESVDTLSVNESVDTVGTTETTDVVDVVDATDDSVVESIKDDSEDVIRPRRRRK